MLSSRTGAALAAGIGLGLVITALMIAVWWTLTQKDRTLVVLDDGRSIEALLASAPSIAVNMPDRADLRPVTIISPRAADGLEQWLGEDALALAKTGREVRAIIVPSGHGGAGEEATVAALWQGRDIGLLRQWLSMRAEHWSAAGVDPVSASPRAMAALAEATALRQTLQERLGRPADDNRWPVVIWRDGAGQLAVCYCHTASATAQTRRALGLKEIPVRPQPVSPPVPREKPAARTDDQAATAGDYPRLNATGLEPAGAAQAYGEVSETARAPMPALPGDAGLAEGAPQVKSAPAARTAPRPPSRPARTPRRDVNTAAPKAEKDADSLFY